MVVWFDLETTGLTLPVLVPRDRQPRIIEICMLADDGREIHGYVDPGMRIPSFITNKIGITQEDVTGAPPFDQIARHAKELIEGADLVVAHNAAFDRAVLDVEFERAGVEVAWPRMMCTVEMSRHLKGYRLDLETLTEMAGIDTSIYQFHGARDDVRALRDCYNWLKEQGEI